MSEYTNHATYEYKMYGFSMHRTDKIANVDFDLLIYKNGQYIMQITDHALAPELAADPSIAEILAHNRSFNVFLMTRVNFRVKLQNKIVLLQARNIPLFDLIPETRTHYLRLLEQAALTPHPPILAMILNSQWELRDINLVGIPLGMDPSVAAPLVRVMAQKLTYPQVDINKLHNATEYILVFRSAWSLAVYKQHSNEGMAWLAKEHEAVVSLKHVRRGVDVSLIADDINEDILHLRTRYDVGRLHVPEVATHLFTMLNSLRNFHFEHDILNRLFNREWLFDGDGLIGTRAQPMRFNAFFSDMEILFE